MHALLARMRESGVRAVAVEVSAQALTRHRVDGLVFDVVVVHQPQPRPPRRLRRHGGVLPGEARRCSSPTAPSAASSRSTPRTARASSTESRIPVTTIATVGHSRPTSTRREWVVEVLDETRRVHRVPAHRPRGPLARDPRAADRLAHGRQRRARDRHARRGGLRARGDRRARSTPTAASRPTCPAAPSGSRATAGPSVYVDFGHSPDAFENTLAAVRKFTPGRTIMVFGADGDRDASKRHEMGRVAAEGCDILVITDHHPRFEDPASIRATLLEGAALAEHQPEIYEVQPARGRDQEGGVARPRGRLDPLGRSRPPGLPRHRGRAHAVLRPGARASRAARGGLGVIALGLGELEDALGGRLVLPAGAARDQSCRGKRRDRFPPRRARLDLLRAARRGHRRSPVRAGGRRGRRCARRSSSASSTSTAPQARGAGRGRGPRRARPAGRRAGARARRAAGRRHHRLERQDDHQEPAARDPRGRGPDCRPAGLVQQPGRRARSRCCGSTRPPSTSSSRWARAASARSPGSCRSRPRTSASCSRSASPTPGSSAASRRRSARRPRW